MTWRDDFRPASFRGVPFKVDSHSHGFGRRTEVHEYPQRDDPSAEDLGRLTRRWRVQAYVIGAEYGAGRDALVKALEAKGPGVLVHPWLGTLTVSVEGEQGLEESVGRGGEAVFNLTFVDAGSNEAPGIAVDTAAAAAVASDAATATAAAQLPATFSVAGMPAFVAGAASGVLGQINTAVAGVVAGMAPAISQLGELQAMGAGFVAQAAALVAAPASLASQVIALVGQVRSLAGNPLAALPGLRALMAFGGDLAVVLGETPSRKRQRANQTALVRLVQRAAAAEAVMAVSAAGFDSYEQAAAIRDDLATAIDVIALEAADAGEDDAFRVLEDLRGALVRDVNERGGSLARVFSWRPGQTLPAEVIAHRIYGDAGRAEEIVARNRIAHPGFVSAGRALELLTPEIDR